MDQGEAEVVVEATEVVVEADNKKEEKEEEEEEEKEEEEEEEEEEDCRVYTSDADDALTRLESARRGWAK